METSGSEKTIVMSMYSFGLSLLLGLVLGACTSQATTPIPVTSDGNTRYRRLMSRPQQMNPRQSGLDYWPTEWLAHLDPGGAGNGLGTFWRN